jgi:hypothetical protein
MRVWSGQNHDAHNSVLFKDPHTTDRQREIPQ